MKMQRIPKEEYDQALNEVLTIISHADPAGINSLAVAAGYQEEYDIEAEAILKKIPSCQGIVELTFMVMEVFEYYFGEPCKFPLQVGDQLIQLRKKYAWLDHSRVVLP